MTDPNSAFFSFMELYFNHMVFSFHIYETEVGVGWGISIAFGNMQLPVIHIIYSWACKDHRDNKGLAILVFRECSCNKTGQGTLTFL